MKQFNHHEVNQHNVFVICRNRKKIISFAMSLCLSVSPHEKIRLPLEGFTLTGNFTKICLGKWRFVKNPLKTTGAYTKKQEYLRLLRLLFTSVPVLQPRKAGCCNIHSISQPQVTRCCNIHSVLQPRMAGCSNIHSISQPHMTRVLQYSQYISASYDRVL